MILLDTHVIVWLMLAPEQLSERAHDAILRALRAEEKIAFCPVSLYEIAYATRRERLNLHASTEDFLTAIQSKLELIPISAAIALCAAELPAPFHGDPMDRIIAATAIVHGCVLITHDSRIRKANACKTLW